jgi:hypothetical protein
MTRETIPSSIFLIEQNLWILLVIVGIVNLLQYVFKVSLMDLIFGKNNELISNWYNLEKDYLNKKTTTTTPPKKIDVSNNIPSPPPVPKKEVFNISNNLYTYDDAKNVCKSFNARLATIDEINKAYEDGAEWCVNSWSDDMQVLYPTQKATYDKLQKIKGAENNCGRTGVNGGRILNKNLRFGINCYGVKPAPTEHELKRMKQIEDYVYPKTKDDMIMEAKVKYWKKNKDKYVIVNPFNLGQWNNIK